MGALTSYVGDVSIWRGAVRVMIWDHYRYVIQCLGSFII